MSGPPPTFGAVAEQDTPQKRNLNASIGQRAASAASSRASAGKNVAETVTETRLRGPKVAKATSEAALAEARAKQAQMAWEKTQRMLAGVPAPKELPAAQQLIINEVRNLAQALKLSRDMFGASGIGYGVTSYFGGSPANDVNALLKPIFANEAFDRLEKMRAASPTGAALGNVTEKELDLLKSAGGVADVASSDKVFQQGVTDLINKRLRVLGKLGADPYAVAEAIGPEDIGNFADKIETYQFRPDDEKALQNYILTSKKDGSYDPSTAAALAGQAYYNATGRAPDEAYIQQTTGTMQRVGEQAGAPSFDYTKSWEKDRQQLVPFVTGQKREEPGLGSTLAGAALNTVPSVFEFAADTVAALTVDLPQTIEGVAQVVGGAAGLSDPAAFEAVKTYYKDRYGTTAGFKEALRTDPASIMADVAGVFTGGATLGAKTANLAGKVSKIAALSNAARSMSGFATTAAKLDPMYAAGKMAGLGLNTAKAVGEQAAIGIPSRLAGVTPTETKQAIQAGREGSQPFLDQLEGVGSPVDPANAAENALSELYQGRSLNYQRRMARMNKTEAVTFDDVDKALQATRDIGQHKGIDISSASGVWDEVYDKVAEFRDAGLSTIEDFDKLKQAVRTIGTKYPLGTPQYKVAKDVAQAIGKTIEAKAPVYANIMKDYRVASDVLADVKATISSGAASTDTVLNKLRRVASGKGPRGTTVLDLLEQTPSGKGLGNMLAGQALSGTEVKGLSGAVAPAAAVATGDPTALAGLLLSPRRLGRTAYSAGELLGGVDNTVALAQRYGLDAATGKLTDLQRRYGPPAAQALRVANPSLIQPMVDPFTAPDTASGDPRAALLERYVPVPRVLESPPVTLDQFRGAPAGFPDLSTYRPAPEPAVTPQPAVIEIDGRPAGPGPDGRLIFLDDGTSAEEPIAMARGGHATRGLAYGIRR